VNGWWLGAAGAKDSVRPRRLIGASGRPLNFTVRGRNRDAFASILAVSSWTDTPQNYG
jgi:hypothetical protein